MSEEIEYIKKLDGAKRHLRAGITLFFERWDQAVVHTVVAAGHNVFRDILKAQGGENPSGLLDLEGIRDEYKSDLYRLLRAPKNFFKHADRDPDPDGSIKMVEFYNEVFIADACSMHLNIVSKNCVETLIFMCWFHINRRKFIKLSPASMKAAKIIDAAANLPHLDHQMGLELIRFGRKFPSSLGPNYSDLDW